jgi:hypothetical protein
MASYLSYFTAGTGSGQAHQYGQQNASSNSSTSTWSSAFSSRISTLRKALTKDSEEDDPDHEDCSHVSNVLRAYYTEKGRAFPEWLPPDPKKPAPAPPPPPQNMYNQYGAGAGYGSQYGSQSDFNRQPSVQQGGLSDLWDSSPNPQPPPQSQSLRAPRPTPQSLRPHDNSSGHLAPSYSQQSASARPLPSQRAGSFQNTAAASPALGSRDRLRAKLQGGGSGRSSPAPQGQQSYSGSATSFESGGGSGGSPYVSASEPWSSSGGNPYDQPTGNPYADSRPSRARPGGLPSGPRGPR